MAECNFSLVKELEFKKSAVIRSLWRASSKCATPAFFSFETVSGLSNSLFFLNGKTFGFRGMEQHKNCAAEQLKIEFDHENNRKYVKYTPRVTKNVQGGLRHRRVEINPIIQYEDR